MTWSEFKATVDARLEGADPEIWYIDVSMPSRPDALDIDPTGAHGPGLAIQN